MKYTRFFPFLLPLLLFFLTGCKKEGDDTTNPVDDVIYNSSCEMQELIWLADNESVLINDFCGPNIYILHTGNRTTRTWQRGNDFLVQKFYYSKDVPGKMFFISLTKNAGGSWEMPFRLYALDLSSFATTLVRDNITENPQTGNYLIGGKKMAIKDPAGTLLIDLELSTTQVLPVTGDLQAFSPDNSKILLYPRYQASISNAVVYDLTCNCQQPVALTGYGTAAWRTQGILGYGSQPGSQQLSIQDFQAGTQLTSFPDLYAGPWIGTGSQHLIFFAKPLQNPETNKGALISYNLQTRQTREHARADYLLVSFLKGIFMAALSHDERKLVFAVDGTKLKMVSF